MSSVPASTAGFGGGGICPGPEPTGPTIVPLGGAGGFIGGYGSHATSSKRTIQRMRTKIPC